MFLEYLQTNQRFFFAVVITAVVSITLHELAHGIVAIWYGDRTPIETGHMTLNPVVHMGGMSLLLLVVAGISWGLMPVNPRRMRGRDAEAMVALAGPVSNILLALIALTILGLWMRFAQADPGTMAFNARYFLLIFGGENVALALFNLIPIPPLDGSRVLAHYSPGYARMMFNVQQQIVIVFLVVFFFVGPKIYDVGFAIATGFLRWVRGW